MVDLTFSEEQQALREVFADLFAQHASVERVRAAEPLGFDKRLWGELVAVDVPLMGVPEAQGGTGATLLDLAVLAQEAGRRIAPAPVVEAVVAANLLARLDGTQDVLAAIGRGDVLPAVALRPVVAGGNGSDGASDTARLVPAGAVADVVVALRGDDLLLLRREDVAPPPEQPPNLAATPVADWPVGAGARVLASGERARKLHAEAVDEWQALTAAALVGLGQTALRIGTEYVKERHAFGVPIGWFQAIQHRLADVTTDLEGAELLAWEAAWARADDSGVAPRRAAALASMALLFAGNAAFQVCRASLQYHGGYGYTLEYDIQLFFRRAKAWPLLAGSPAERYQALAETLFTTHDTKQDTTRGRA